MKVARLDQQRIPRHIAIIMDGNSRWARLHGVSRAAGHEAGAKSVRAVIEACRELGKVEALTLYAFSTENWRRSKTEISTLFRLLSKYIALELEEIHQQDIRIRAIGRLDALPSKARQDLEYAMERTAANKSMTVLVALNYGARAEIVDASRKIAEEVQAGRLTPQQIDENVFSQYLYEPRFPDVDLLIRTSGEMRISNFMLWQLSYAEIYVTPTLWPNFRKEHLYEAIAEFQSRQRRFGGRTRSK